jgi:hypothetical protein
MARGTLALLLLYSPWRRRRAGQAPELIAVLRHVEMYLFAEPGAVEPAGELLSGPLHARQHAHHRQLRRDAGEPLGGYAAHIVQRRGVGEHGGRHSTGSVNLMTAGFELCVRALDVRGQPTKIMAHGGFLVDEMAKDLGLSCDAPVDLVAGPYFTATVDLRSASADDDDFLVHVLRPPALIRRISVSPESLREGTAAQQEVAAQPEARLLLAFHRLRCGSAYSRRLSHRKPARGTPELCLDADDYARAPHPFAL